MTQNSELIFNFMKDNFGKEFSKHQIAEALDVSVNAVTGSINGLLKKGLVSERKETVVNFDGKTIEVRYATMTEAGLTFDPVAYEAAQKAARDAAAAARREAKKAAKAAAAADAE